MSSDLDLTQLSEADLIQQTHDDLYDGLADEVVAEVKEFLRRGWTPYDTLTRGLVAGMDIVGIDFRDGILFVPEVLMAAKAMKAGMEILRPLLAETGAPQIGTMVIGTVKGDIHDIGKNLVAMMLQGSGYEIVDLGIDVKPEAFVAAIRDHKPDIVGMAALLTTTMKFMKDSIDAIDTAGLPMPEGAMAALLAVDRKDWKEEARHMGEFFSKFGDRLPAELKKQREDLVKRLGK